MDLITNKWTNKDYDEYLKYLLNQEDLKYEKFNHSLIITKYKMIGIRIPIAKSIAKEISKGDYKSFLGFGKNTYYEEILIEGLIIALKGDKELMEKHFSKIDNWGLCDYFCMNAKFIKKDPKYFPYFLKFLKSKDEFTVRIGLIMILCYFVKDVYIDTIFKEIEKIKCDEYYVKMGVAWLLSECFIKFPKETKKYLLNTKINDWTFNKTISKIKESNRVSREEKDYVDTLRRRTK